MTNATRRPAARVRTGVDRALAGLDRLVPIARRLVGAVRAVAVVTALAGVAILLSVLSWGLPESRALWGGLGLVVVVLVAPLVPIWLFAAALGEVLELPSTLRRAPDVGRAHAVELGQLVREARERPGHERAGSLPGDLVRAGRLLLGVHDDFPGYGAVLRLVSVPFLFVVACSFTAAFVVLCTAPVIVAGTALLHLV